MVQMSRRRVDRFQNRVRVAAIRIVTNHREDRPVTLFPQVHDMLGLVGQVCGAVLHFHDLGVGVVRVLPVVVGSLLGTFPVELREVGTRGRLDPRRLRQPPQKVRVRLARVLPHDRSQGRIRFEERAIHADGPAIDQSLSRQNL